MKSIVIPSTPVAQGVISMQFTFLLTPVSFGRGPTMSCRFFVFFLEVVARRLENNKGKKKAQAFLFVFT